MSSIITSWTDFPDVPKNSFFVEVAKNNVSEVPKLALVCKKWQRALDIEDTWTPIFKNFSHINHDLFLIVARKDKIERCVIAQRHHNFQTHLKKSNFTGKELTTKDDLTDLFETMINVSELGPHHYTLESLASFFLFKPLFNPNKIAQILVSKNFNRQNPMRCFCFNMLVKLHYDLTDFFKNFVASNNDLKSGMACLPLMSSTDLHLSDLLQSGCVFKSFETNKNDIGSNFSLISHVLVPVLGFYRTGKFLSYNQEFPVFTNEKLFKYVRKEPFSEEELKQFLRDLFFKCELNPNIKLPPAPPLCPTEGTALSHLKTLAESQLFPKDNALKVVLDEFIEQASLNNQLAELKI